MRIAPGSRLGPYEVLTSIGAGGMGEVWKARDTRLDRTVAIKVLPEHLSEDADLRRRFEREAKTISSLSHPHICSLYDVGEQNGAAYLVMELLEGETLAERLVRGRLPSEQVLRFAIQIADALDKAHRQGVVHRDLKPSNIMITKSGVKLLDFGLAKLRALESPAPPGASRLTTAVAPAPPLTERGMIVGTCQYMSPEQLEGKEADARSDIFAFGAVVYEMSTGRKAFSGASQASLIASILEHDPPPISSIQAMAPPGLDRLVRTCLAKDPEDRWQTAHDLRRELEWIAQSELQPAASAPAPARRLRGERIAWATCGLALILAAAFASAYFRRAPPASSPIRASVVLPEKMLLGEMALSPDGTRIAFTLSKSGGQPALWIRPLDAPAGHPLSDADNASFPFWSPDGRFVAFFSGDGKLKRVDASGGAVLDICDAERGLGGTWNRDGTIVFAPGPTSALYRVPARGGQPTPVTQLRASPRETAHRYPSFLPDGRHFLYLACNLSAPPRDPANAIRIGSLDGRDDRPLVREASNALFASGYLLYAREETLLAQKLDARNEPVGEPLPLAPRVPQASWAFLRRFTASGNGLLLYAPLVPTPSQLLWLDREGKQIGSVGDPSVFLSPRLSPDGRRIAVDVLDPTRNSPELWLYNADATGARRLVLGVGSQINPVWSPDGTRVAFGSDRKARGVHPDLWVKSVDGGTEETLVENGDFKTPDDWSRDGRYLSYQSVPAQGKRAIQVWIFDFAARTARALLTNGNFSGDSRFSPDGNWIAYDSDETGRSEVFVQAFPSPGGKWQISSAGGAVPRWRGDGKEIFYLSLDNRIMAVPVERTPAFRAGPPIALFAVHPPSVGSWTGSIGSVMPYDVAADGRRFLVNSLPAEQGSPPLSLVVRWTGLLPK